MNRHLRFAIIAIAGTGILLAIDRLIFHLASRKLVQEIEAHIESINAL